MSDTFSCADANLMACFTCAVPDCPERKWPPEHWKLVSIEDGYHLIRRDGVVISSYKTGMGFWGWAVIGGWPTCLRTDFWCLAEGAMEYPDPLCFLDKFDADCPVQEVEPGDEFLDETMYPREAGPKRKTPEEFQKTAYTVADLIRKFNGSGA